MAIPRLLLIVLLTYVPHASASGLSPREIAKAFYAWVIKHDGGGLPSDSALKAAEPIISSELRLLLRKAQMVERRCVAKAPPDMKPPIFEGSLFVDNYEGATRVISMDLHSAEAGILVASQLEFKDPRWQVEAITWKDQLMLVQEKGKWVVADTNGTAKSKSLVVTLKDYLRAFSPKC